MKVVYGLACVVGILFPMSVFLPWLLEGQGITTLYFAAIATPMSAFAWADVLVSAIVLLVFAEIEGKRIGLSRRWPVWLATLCVGVSFGLPLFLLLREFHLEKTTAAYSS